MSKNFPKRKIPIHSKKRCRKRRYRNAADAYSALRKIGLTMNVYRCPYCPGNVYHLGREDE